MKLIINDNGKFYEENVNTSKEDILKVLDSLKGKYIQEVPIYSAVKVNGKKLYEYARKGQEVELKPRDIDIKELELISFDGVDVVVRLKVNKGFYVRSFVNDLGQYLKCGAIMTDLRRLQAGNFDIKDSFTLDKIEDGNYKVISIEEVLSIYPKIDVDDFTKKLVLNGVVLDERQFKERIPFRIYHNNELIAFYEPFNDKEYKLVMKVI